jgi:hypothetical protein
VKEYKVRFFDRSYELEEALREDPELFGFEIKQISTVVFAWANDWGIVAVLERKPRTRRPKKS